MKLNIQKPKAIICPVSIYRDSNFNCVSAKIEKIFSPLKMEKVDSFKMVKRYTDKKCQAWRDRVLEKARSS